MENYLRNSVWAKSAHTASLGKTYQADFCNLDLKPPCQYFINGKVKFGKLINMMCKFAISESQERLQSIKLATCSSSFCR